MGAGVNGTDWDNQVRQRYREKVRQDLDVFERMLASQRFDGGTPTTGCEVELSLVDADLRPSRCGADLLTALDDPSFVPELGRFNVEMNITPRVLVGDRAFDLEKDLDERLANLRRIGAGMGASPVSVGIVPTLMPSDLTDGWMSRENRFQALNDAIMRARGEDLCIDIEGHTGERVAFYSDSIAPESACTSFQLHLQVMPQRFARVWNAAQALAGPQVAVAANSPYFYGSCLWHETRIVLFQQAADTRSVELVNQGVRPRVCFGDRWITSIFDLFEDNVRYYPALLPELSDENPVAVLDEGRAPQLTELMLHNGTVYRWNRPIYDTSDGRPHLRVENRVLPSGPTPIDMVANAAFYYGLVAALSAEDRPVWTQMSFSAAEANFRNGARDGMLGRMYWPGYATLTAEELTLRHLLGMAHDGLSAEGVSSRAADRYLGVIEGRCLSRQNGASWQIDTVRRWESQGLDRASALREMLRLYIEFAATNEPVHTWALPEDHD
ncbi:Glutamate--cysteine ligase [Austwickia sp. TVS 96-490-7B]|uniref:glutamate--cysteine ligase n=1 Tax=Austwickia sp. TVS 96-490-7B TaxID=2830843 RepID=UPI001C5883EA|nr:glutamate--cysteine ligase [Austwickia sp. TVS 96-490-7B]MBW3086278.1 Glutamate--cysteine ligase [Austwickia sp. TVS 96-490-7B]